MEDYEFELIFKLKNENEESDIYLDALFEEGCDDAIVSMGKNGVIVLNFTRCGSSAFKAIQSAIINVQQAIPDTILIEASPDYVGITDIARIFEFSRQNARKIFSKSNGPLPIHMGSSSIWHLSDVLKWVNTKGFTHYDVLNSTLLDVANTTKKLNFEIETQKNRNNNEKIESFESLVIYR